MPRMAVSIIKERRAISNFQLIIITHDEKFLQKLGEADVMEYYWSVLLVFPIVP
jgi:DNA repair protein RAD50